MAPLLANKATTAAQLSNLDNNGVNPSPMNTKLGLGSSTGAVRTAIGTNLPHAGNANGAETMEADREALGAANTAIQTTTVQFETMHGLATNVMEGMLKMCLKISEPD